MTLAGAGVSPSVYAAPQSQITYGSTGQVSQVVLPNGQTYGYGYDLAGQVGTYRQPNAYASGPGGSVGYAHDGQGSLTQLTDPRAIVTGYALSGFGELTQRTSPDTGVTTFVRNNGGLVTSRTNAKGTASFTYDALNRPTSANYGDQQATYQYDGVSSSGGTTGVGHLTSMTDTSGSTAWQYDKLGRMTTKSQTIASTSASTSARISPSTASPGGSTLSVQYTYLPGGRVATITYPSGAVVAYAYSINRVTSVSLNGTPLLTDITYNAAGQVTGWTMGAAGAYQKTFDTFGRVTAYSYASGTRTLSWDDSSRLTALTNPDGSVWTYSYDNLDRLKTAFEQAYANKTYAFDLSGNLLTESNPAGEAYTATYDTASNKMLSLKQPARTRDYAWDGVGDMLTNGLSGSAGPFTLSWNNAGYLTQVSGNSQALRLVTNGLGQRVKKSISTGAGCTSVVHQFIYAEDGVSLLGDYQQGLNATCASGAVTRASEFVYLAGLPVALLRDTGAYYLMPDQLGTVRTIKDTAGSTVWIWPSDAFGRVAPNGNPSGQAGQPAFSFPLRFPGQYYDQESGMVYNNARYYDAETGRYYSSDPIGLEGGLSTYPYAAGSPVTVRDANGLHVDLNLFSADEAVKEYAEMVPSIPGAFIVGSHGNSAGVQDGRGLQKSMLNAKSLAALIRSSPGYTQGTPVYLYACNTGKDPDGIAYQLGLELKANVIAPPNFIYYMPAHAPEQGVRPPSGAGDWQKYVNALGLRLQVWPLYFLFGSDYRTFNYKQ